MKKALIHIGAGPLQKATLESARKAGFYVVATDAKSDAPNARLADEFHVIKGDDAEKLMQLAHDLSNRFDVAGAYAGSDFGIIPVALIHEQLSLPGCPVDTVRLSLDKYRSKQVFVANGIETPRGWLLNRSDDKIPVDDCKLPLVVKPVDSCGSQGVCSVEQLSALPGAVETAFTYSPRVLVEECFEGVGVDTIGIVWDGRFIACGIGTRIFSEKPYHFPIYGHSPPALSEKEIDAAYDLTSRAAFALGIDHSPVKADLLFRDGTFTVLEVTPRFHGDVFTSMLIPFSRKTVPAGLLFHLMAGVPVTDLSPAKHAVVLWHALFPLSFSVDFEDVRRRLGERWKVISFYFDKTRFKKILKHRDNCSLVGFFWVELDAIEDVELFRKEFKGQFGKELL